MKYISSPIIHSPTVPVLKKLNINYGNNCAWVIFLNNQEKQSNCLDYISLCHFMNFISFFLFLCFLSSFFKFWDYNIIALFLPYLFSLQAPTIPYWSLSNMASFFLKKKVLYSYIFLNAMCSVHICAYMILALTI